MLVLVGYGIVLASVLGGYLLGGGHLAPLFQPFELVIIAGAALGAFVTGNSPKTLQATLRALPACFRGSHHTKASYLALMGLLFDILTKARKEGLMSIERDVEKPQESPLFTKYPGIASDYPLVEFLSDYLRLMVSGNLNPMEIESLMDHEIETRREEGAVPGHAVQKIGDGLPAFGIVAAVMGVVHTMGSVGKSPAELGMMIAGALVGTFLGILLSYGFVGPLAGVLEHHLEESLKELQCVKVTLLASLNGYAPPLAIEFGRKVLYSTERPSFSELEQHLKQARGR